MLVPPGDPPALAAALDGLLMQPERARELGARARARAAAVYDVSHMVRAYSAIYDDAPLALVPVNPHRRASRRLP